MPDYERIAEGVNIPDPAGATEIPTDQASQAQKDWYAVDHPRYQGIAEAKGYDQSYARLKTVHYTHDAMIDVIIAEPAIKQGELAKMFDKSGPWISRILGSDAFQAALAKRREEVTDPFLIATIEERFRGLASQSLDILADKLDLTKNADLALKSLDISVKALGFGARGGSGNQVQNNFVVHLPQKAASATEWAESNNPMKRLESNG